MNPSDIEKTKSPILSFLFGVVIAASITWYVMDTIKSEQLNTNEMSITHKNELISVHMEEIRNLKLEISKLEKNKSDSDKLISGYNAGKELKELIATIDVEITEKKIQLAASSPLMKSISENGTETSSKSDTYKRHEKELELLVGQRDLARKKQIELFSTK